MAATYCIIPVSSTYVLTEGLQNEKNIPQSSLYDTRFASLQSSVF